MFLFLKLYCAARNVSECIHTTMLGNRHPLPAPCILQERAVTQAQSEPLPCPCVSILAWPGGWSGWSGDCPKAVGKTPALSLWGGGAPEAPRRLRSLSLSRPGQRIVFQLSEAFGLCCGCARCFHAETTPSTFSPCCFAQHFGSMYSGFYWYFWFSVVGFEQWLPTF